MKARDAFTPPSSGVTYPPPPRRRPRRIPDGDDGRRDSLAQSRRASEGGHLGPPVCQGPG